jgi:hypothetical protein
MNCGKQQKAVEKVEKFRGLNRFTASATSINLWNF